MLDTFHEKAPTPGHVGADVWAWRRARQLEGTLGDDSRVGVWLTTYQRILHGWGCPTFSKAKLELASVPTTDPNSISELAAAGRIGLYYRVWNANDALKALQRQQGVSAAFRICEQWRNPSEGRLDFVQSEDSILGGHCLPIVLTRFDFPRPAAWGDDDYFVGPNSWGANWGNRGFYAMRYDFFDREMYEAWTIDYRSEMPRLFGTGVQDVLWNSEGDIEQQFRLYDIVDADADNRLAWGIAVLKRGEFHVEELFVKPEARRRGFASRIVRKFQGEAQRLGLPLRFWIPFADVQDRSSLEGVQSFFARHGIGFETSRFRSAAFCGVVGGNPHPPPFRLPPKASYVFTAPVSPAVNWDNLQREFNVSDEFVKQAQETLGQHGDTLRRLA